MPELNFELIREFSRTIIHSVHIPVFYLPVHPSRMHRTPAAQNFARHAQQARAPVKTFATTLQRTPMTVTLDTTATTALVRELADAACAKPGGSRWKNVSIVQMTNTCARFHEEMVRRNEGGELTLGQLLKADMVAAYCDGDTENRRHVGDREIAAEDHRRTVRHRAAARDCNTGKRL